MKQRKSIPSAASAVQRPEYRTQRERSRKTDYSRKGKDRFSPSKFL